MVRHDLSCPSCTILERGKRGENTAPCHQTAKDETGSDKDLRHLHDRQVHPHRASAGTRGILDRMSNLKPCGACNEPGCKHKCTCKLVFYCGHRCQRKHWPVHRVMCTARKVSPSENIEDEGRKQGQRQQDASNESDEACKDDNTTAAGQEYHLAANVFRRQGQYKDAELNYLEARRIALDVLAEGSEVVGDLSLNLGNMYGEMGKYEEALEEIEKGLQIMRRTKGEISMEAGSALHCIGGILLTQGNLEEALPRLLEARNILLEAVGLDHPLRRAVLQSLGSCYDLMGRPRDAGVARREALRISKITEGDGPSDGEQAGKTLENLAHDFSDMGDLAMARDTYDGALDEYRLVHGDNHPNVAYAHNNLAGILVQQGQLNRALEELETALKIKYNELGVDHVGVAHSLKNVGIVLDRQGEHGQARKMYSKALAIFARALGRIDCYQIADVHDSIARSMAMSGDLKRALENARESMRIYNILGLDNQDSQAAHGLLRMLEVNAMT